MADRVYPSAKPNPHPPTSSTAPAFPATKGQTYARAAYRPPPTKQQRRRRSGRSCCCSCCLWLTLLLIAAVFLAAIAGGVFYVLYRPHRPTFSLSSLKLSTFNLTAGGVLTSRLDVTVTARNPNSKISFLYDPISVSAYSSSGGVLLGSGSFDSFLHASKNTTLLRTTVSAAGETVDSSEVPELRKSMKTSVPLRLELDTRAGVKIGKLKTKRIGVRVRCEGVSVPVPKGKGGGKVTSPDVSCKVKLRIKIWKWTV